MTLSEVFYWVFISACCAYAFSIGGRTERRVAAALLLASVLSALAYRLGGHDFAEVERGIFAIDVGLLAYLLWIALRTDRFWPLWTAAFQLVAAVTHAAKLVGPDVLPIAYAFVLGLWAYPTWLTLCIGTRAVGRGGEVEHDDGNERALFQSRRAAQSRSDR